MFPVPLHPAPELPALRHLSLIDADVGQFLYFIIRHRSITSLHLDVPTPPTGGTEPFQIIFSQLPLLQSLALPSWDWVGMFRMTIFALQRLTHLGIAGRLTMKYWGADEISMLTVILEIVGKRGFSLKCVWVKGGIHIPEEVREMGAALKDYRIMLKVGTQANLGGL